jgi:hypothetical protein
MAVNVSQPYNDLEDWERLRNRRFVQRMERKLLVKQYTHRQLRKNCEIG